MQHQPLQSVNRHTAVDCTYTVVEVDGERQLQLDTYGSAGRAVPGKKSQSLRLSQSALAQLKQIIQDNGL
ncbi:MAG: hypothetical protein HZY78_14075 [Burkholderiaceae bacterium]|nr:MAG: hypothetical protein HZY78_14075 [Burkholderiaceae bacterium]